MLVKNEGECLKVWELLFEILFRVGVGDHNELVSYKNPCFRKIFLAVEKSEFNFNSAISSRVIIYCYDQSLSLDLSRTRYC